MAPPRAVLGATIHLMRAAFITLSLLLPASAAVASGAAASSTGPLSGPAPPSGQQANVVILLADDLGYGDLGCYGAPLIATPRLDAMASEGVQLDSFYVQPRCSPTRAALLTGFTPQRMGVFTALSQWSEYGLSSSEVTVAEMMLSAGYRTGYFGKWHLGDSPGQLPQGQGFEHYLTSPWGHLAEPNAYVDSTSPVWEWEPDPRLSTERFTARTLDFIEESVQLGAPFLAVLAYSTPHVPAISSPAFDGVSADGREYGDAVEELDHSAGQVLDLIDSLGIEEDTLVIFLSDNGPAGPANPYQAGSTGGLRGAKGSTFEGGIRVPFIAKWPSIIPAGLRLTDLGSDVDLTPTILEAANIAAPPQVNFDGISLLSTITGGQAAPARPLFRGAGASLDAIRFGQWKLRQGELFNLINDPAETTDVAAQFGGIVALLQSDLDSFSANVTANARAPEPRSTFIGVWNPSIGLPASGPLASGRLWQSPQQPQPSWQVFDLDASADFEIVPRTGPGPGDLTTRVIRAATPSADLRLVRQGLPAEASSAFSVALWTRSIEPQPSEQLVLLDVGNAAEGVSITVGDGGILGDDPTPGVADDLRVRLRGSQSGAATTATVDLPSEWSTELTHLLVTYDKAGDLVVYLQGSEAARVPAQSGAIDSLPTAEWNVFGRDGSLGASGGTGPAPFNALTCMGELGGITIQSRAMFRQEMERSLCRHVKYSYCSSPLNSVGEYADLDLAGRFFLDAEDLQVRVRNIPPNTFGFLLASRAQRRLPVSSGYVCLAGPIFRISRQISQADASGSVNYTLDPLLAPAALDLQNSTFMNFQYWFRDGGASNFTNAVNVIFCP